MLHVLIIYTNQEARGVIQEAAEATHKAPLQEGGVLWGKLLRVILGTLEA